MAAGKHLVDIKHVMCSIGRCACHVEYKLREGVVNDIFQCTAGEHFVANNILFLRCIFPRCRLFRRRC